MDPFGKAPQIHYEPIYVARQPVYDRKRRVWGYELLFRRSIHDLTAGQFDPDAATAGVIADGFAMALDGLDATKRILINFPKNLLLSGAAYALPSHRCIAELLETIEPDAEVIAACRRLKESGFSLALDDFIGQPGFEELLDVADIVKVDVLGMEKAELVKLTQSLKRRKVELLAEKIEDKAVYELCKALGYHYFQGYWFAKPVIIPGRKLTAGETVKVQLLAALGVPDFDLKKISRIIASDPALSYRFLKFINSASFCFTSKFASLDQAAVLLGQKPLKQWLLVVALSDLASDPAFEDASHASVQRGKFLADLAEDHPTAPLTSESMFLLGLLSRLDVLMGMPMETLLKSLPLDESIHRALLGEHNEVRDWLELAVNLERGDWPAVERLVGLLRLDPAQAAIAHAKASVWAHETLGAYRKTS